METAAHPNFQHNLMHTILYRVHVLGETLDNPPPLPPYYPVSFFNTIRHVKENTPLNITTISTAQWYRVLIEDITMMEDNEQSRTYIHSRAELASPGTDWVTSWRRARLKGLGTAATSFLFKLLHRILPSEDRLARILPNSSPNCRLCSTPTPVDLPHCFFHCDGTRTVGNLLLNAVRVHDPEATPERLLRFELQAEEEMEMPIVWLIAHTLMYLWGTRSNSKTAGRYQTRASLESKISLLRETRYINEATLLEELVNQSM